MKGFVSMSACGQDDAFVITDCQQSLMAAAEPVADGNSLGFDVRQSRFNFSVKGPQVLLGATPTAVLEIDFMQGFGAGAFGSVSLLNRMRLAYSELSWGANRLVFGQMNDLTFAMAPVSLSHIAFPLGFATGSVGWRRPGIWGFHTVEAAPDVKVELAWMLGRSQWNEAATGIGANAVNQPNGIGQGEASALPAVEARATLSYAKLLTAYVAGHYNKVDLNGVGASGGDTIAVQVLTGGAKVTYGPITVAANGYAGKNTGPLLGNLVQFDLGPASASVSDVGFWAQAGFYFTKELSAWALYGQQAPDAGDAKGAKMARLKSKTANLMVQYRDGGYALSAEWINFKTTNASYDGAGAFLGSKVADANQYVLTANYFF